jgi:acyl-CoA reductase-like NAD-dependent aldehyde dehydrogenase
MTSTVTASTGAPHVAELVARARAAHPGWAAVGFDARAKLMRRLRSALIGELDGLIETLQAESGRTREDLLFGEVYYCCDSLGFWARHAGRYLADERIRSRSPLALGRTIRVRRTPRGVIGVIAPWNFPLALGLGDAIPALMAGNAVVLKPSSVTPHSSRFVERAWRAAGGDPDVFSVADGPGAAGAALVDEADMIMFTGSVETGRLIAEQAARRLIPVSLELGGKDPMIVLRDADLDHAAAIATQFAFWNSGQLCMSVERAYVEAPVYEAFVANVLARTRALRQSTGGPAGTAEVGAMITAEQVDVVERHVADAVAKGARILTGGGRDGLLLEPTVLVDVDHTMLLMTEETFGPVLPIMRVADAEEAVSLANDSLYGLNASVFSRDLALGERVAESLETGNACVNDAVVNAGIQAAPFGAVKDSGLGTRNSPEGIRKYCTAQTILVTRHAVPGAGILNWPNASRSTRAVERALRLLWGRA